MFNDILKLREGYKNINCEISYINQMLKSATDYSGDVGEPCCTSPEELINVINNWLVYTGKSNDFEVYIDKSFGPSYVQIRSILPIYKYIPTSQKSTYIEDISNGVGIFAIILAKAQMIDMRAMIMAETVCSILEGDVLSNLTDEQFYEINNDLSKANEIYEKALSKIILSTNDDPRKTAIEDSKGVKFRFNDYSNAVSFLRQFSDCLFDSKSITVAGAFRLYGISNYDINDEKRGWKGGVNITVEKSIERENTFYYAVIHDDPVKLV